MSATEWVSLLNWNAPEQTTTGSPLASSTSITDISPTQRAFVPANLLNVGSILRFTAAGIYSTTSTPTLTIGLYWGGSASGVNLGSTVAITTPSTVTNATWILNATSRVSAIGSSGTILTQGLVFGFESVSLAGASGSVTLLPGTTSTGGAATISTTGASNITVAATWGTSSSSNTITCYTFLVELLN